MANLGLSWSFYRFVRFCKCGTKDVRLDSSGSLCDSTPRAFWVWCIYWIILSLTSITCVDGMFYECLSAIFSCTSPFISSIILSMLPFICAAFSRESFFCCSSISYFIFLTWFLRSWLLFSYSLSLRINCFNRVSELPRAANSSLWYIFYMV